MYEGWCWSRKFCSLLQITYVILSISLFARVVTEPKSVSYNKAIQEHFFPGENCCDLKPVATDCAIVQSLGPVMAGRIIIKLEISPNRGPQVLELCILTEISRRLLLCDFAIPRPHFVRCNPSKCFSHFLRDILGL